jgi:hypothetical protein
MTPRPVTISVVMPVLDGRHYLERSLPPLISKLGEGVAEVIVVDDGSTDGSAEFAREQGARVLSSGGRRLGPARARNVGAGEASGDVLLFVDADVVIHEDAPELVLRALENPEIGAVFGSYDATPPHRGFASRYMNLRHHFVHQTPSEDAPTFWAGLGAVRRSAFLEVGGYDGGTFARPSVEDIELGLRLRTAGNRIARRPRIEGTHLKEWGLGEMLRTDIFQRAVPWSRMMLRHPGAFGDLNVSPAERLKALVAAALLGGTIAALFPWIPFWVPLVLITVAWAINRPLITVFARRGGALFALVALLYHQIYYLYSGAVFAWCTLEHALQRRGGDGRNGG